MEPVNVIDDDDEDDDNDQNSMTEVPSGSKAKHANHIRGVVARMTRIRRRILKKFKHSFVQRHEMVNLCAETKDTLTMELFHRFLKLQEKLSIIIFEQLYMQNHVLSFQPSSSSTSIRDLQHQLYLKMKDDPQSQAANHDMWNILKEKIEINSAPFDSRKLYDF
ncbi:hypothetical protein Tco_0026107 [Tanacetum coccineum]